MGGFFSAASVDWQAGQSTAPFILDKLSDLHDNADTTRVDPQKHRMTTDPLLPALTTAINTAQGPLATYLQNAPAQPPGEGLVVVEEAVVGPWPPLAPTTPPASGTSPIRTDHT
ncbi:hypothetical protein AB0I84_33850 [Streptomyces spectabilis]|uniref:hypothetical protein n=1 Tax=Streptomyces spectabilis TaxID=68270 RepID=UPI0033FA16AB